MEWPDTRLGMLSPQDPRFPLPGTVGPELSVVTGARRGEEGAGIPDVLSEPMAMERQGEMLQQYLDLAQKVT